eukprot:TRINITY_DN16412_c0_g1_i3.p1 TRINITY_DN16412_c0_g1~~TRINITY_DN16412_c0_g1_i3.p1  ORF type:complete len:294 (-),score=68.66 TRINITY_DN16412_c0_g1_i3:490-1371(-)
MCIRDSQNPKTPLRREISGYTAGSMQSKINKVMVDDILKIVSSSISEDGPLVCNTPSCEDWYIPTRVALAPAKCADPCALKLGPSNSQAKKYGEAILEELVASTPLIEEEPKSIIDSWLPCDTKFANHMSHKYLLERFKEANATKYEKIPSAFMEAFNEAAHIQPYTNLWTTQDFNPLTGASRNLQSELLPENDQRLEIVEESTKSSDNSTKDRYYFALNLSVFMLKKLNKKRVLPAVPSELKVDPEKFWENEMKVSAQAKKVMEKEEDTLELLRELEVPRMTVIVSTVEEVN